MFGISAFSETAFSESKTASESIFLGTLPIIYFNNSTLTFPLKINKLSNFSLNFNSITSLSLEINTLGEFDLEINKLQNHNLSINKIINFTKRR